MSIVIFIIALVALILVHELGHFIVAKLVGMRVDEFGLGYPPRALLLGKVGETEYTLNWIPFGGFVKIYGENGLDEAEADLRAFNHKSRPAQALVLVAGVAMNLVFAYLLITTALWMGAPRALSSSEVATAERVELAVAGVLPSSPATRAGIAPGDSIISAESAAGQWHAADPKSFLAFIAASKGDAVTLKVKHNEEVSTVTATPATGVATTDPKRYALGVEVATIGVVPLSLGESIVQGASLTVETTKLTAVGLGHFFWGIFTFSADLSQVAGPIGIAGVVGGAATRGWGDLLSIVAVISINLALINLIPIPALDGGRLLFVCIEGIIRRPIKASVVQMVNTASFVLLILLMVVVSVHDIFKLIG